MCKHLQKTMSTEYISFPHKPIMMQWVYPPQRAAPAHQPATYPKKDALAHPEAIYRPYFPILVEIPVFSARCIFTQRAIYFTI